MLAVSNLGITKGSQTILSGVNLEVLAQERVVVLGPSGSGKSTLLRAIAGLEPLSSGQILWEGRDLATVPPHRRKFGLMFQNYALFPHLTVAKNVSFGLKMLGLSSGEIRKQTDASLEWVGLSDRAHASVQELSGGEAQRVALARTLAPKPRLLMLDEPLASLDQNLRARLLEETLELLETQQITAIYVTHDQAEAERVGDRIALLIGGTIVQTGSLAELQSSPLPPIADFFAGSI